MKVAIALLVLVGLVLVTAQETTKPPPGCEKCTEAQCCLKKKGEKKNSCVEKPKEGGPCDLKHKPKNGVYKHSCPCVEGTKCVANEKGKKHYGKCKKPSA